MGVCPGHPRGSGSSRPEASPELAARAWLAGHCGHAQLRHPAQCAGVLPRVRGALAHPGRSLRHRRRSDGQQAGSRPDPQLAAFGPAGRHVLCLVPVALAGPGHLACRDGQGPCRADHGLRHHRRFLVLAYLTTRFIEKPWREWKWPEARRRRALVAIAAAVAIAAVPLAAWQLQINYALAAAAARPGPITRVHVRWTRATSGGPTNPLRSFPPWPRRPMSGPGSRVVARLMEALVNICTNGKQNAAKTVVVIGNSHAHVWSTPILTLADKYGWKVKAITKGTAR